MHGSCKISIDFADCEAHDGERADERVSRVKVADQDAVQATLNEFEGTILDVVHGAWRDFRQLQQALPAPLLYARTRACFVQDLMVQRAQAAFCEDPRVRIIEKDETAKFVFDGSVVVRFKKADESGLGSNIPTQAVMQFVEQQQELPGFPNMHKVEVLYHLNKLQTQVDHVMVVARDGGRLLWEYAMTAAEEAGQVVMFPAAQEEPQRGAKIKIRKPDTGSEKKQGE